MDTLKPVTDFFNQSDFFTYHGYGLTLLWIVGSTLGILLKKANVYLHALAFFLVDVSTLFLVSGAIFRYWNKFASIAEWSLVLQLHVAGGLFVTALIVYQHITGVVTLLSQTKVSRGHRRFAFWVSNLARLAVVVGWVLKGDQTNLMYASIASAVLLIASFYKVYIVKEEQIIAKEIKVNKAHRVKRD